MKETIDIDIHVTYRSGDRKIMQSIKVTSRPPLRIRQQEKDRQSCISVFVAYVTIPSSNYGGKPRHDNSIPCMVV